MARGQVTAVTTGLAIWAENSKQPTQATLFHLEVHYH
jgi:hypothetical protein